MDYKPGDIIPLSVLENRMDKVDNKKDNQPVKVKLVQVDKDLYLGVWDKTLTWIISNILKNNPVIRTLPKEQAFELVREGVYKNLTRRKRKLYSLLKEGREFIGFLSQQRIPITYCKEGEIVSPKTVKGEIKLFGQDTHVVIHFAFRIKDEQISNLLNRLLKS